MAFIGINGRKRFTDQTLPPGTRRGVCQITPLRSTGRGETAQFLLQFGTSAGGAQPMDRKVA